jgi:DNA-binding response OmpR family regulator
MRILLVEDDIKIVSFITKGLKAAGYAVDHAADGEEGFNLALTNHTIQQLLISCSQGAMGYPSLRN